MDARKNALRLKQALALLEEVDQVFVAKGPKLERLDLTAGRPDSSTLARLLLGPTGNLRAPTLRVGRTLLVGFDESTYRKVLG